MSRNPNKGPIPVHPVVDLTPTVITITIAHDGVGEVKTNKLISPYMLISALAQIINGNALTMENQRIGLVNTNPNKGQNPPPTDKNNGT